MPTGFPDYYGGLTLPLTVPEGGTGYTSVLAHNLLIGNGTGALTLLAPGTSGYVLVSNGAAANPSWQQITLSGGSITGIVPIANGGTGTATPALVAGSNISITGTWPANTIALVASPSVTTLVVTPTSDAGGIVLHGKSATSIAPGIQLYDDTASAARGYFGMSEYAGSFLSTAVAGDIIAVAETGNLLLGTAGVTALTIDQSQVMTLAHPLAIASGGTGAASLAAAGLPQIVASYNATGQTAVIGSTTLYATTPGGMYRISAQMYLHSPTGTSSVSVNIVFQQNGVAQTPTALITLSAITTDTSGSSVYDIYCDAGSNIVFYTLLTSGGGADSYDLHLRLEAI